MLHRAILAGLVAGALGLSAPLQAQRPAPKIELTPYAGYMSFGSIVSGPLGSRLGNSGAPVVGGQVTVPLMRHLALYGNVGYSAPRLQVGVPVLGGLSLGESSVWMYDAGVQLRAPLGGEDGRSSVTPFLQAGVGGMRTSFDVASVTARATSTTLNVGAGAEIALSPSLGLQLMAKDYIGRMSFGVENVGGFRVSNRTNHNVALSAGLSLRF